MKEQDMSEHECMNCGKQLWKRYFAVNCAFEDGELEFCSKKCGKEYVLKYLDFEKIDIL